MKCRTHLRDPEARTRRPVVRRRARLSESDRWRQRRPSQPSGRARSPMPLPFLGSRRAPVDRRGVRRDVGRGHRRGRHRRRRARRAPTPLRRTHPDRMTSATRPRTARPIARVVVRVGWTPSRRRTPSGQRPGHRTPRPTPRGSHEPAVVPVRSVRRIATSGSSATSAPASRRLPSATVRQDLSPGTA